VGPSWPGHPAATRPRPPFGLHQAAVGHRDGERAAGRPFADVEARCVGRLAPHLAEGLRAGLLVASLERDPPRAELADAPGLVVLDHDGTVVAISEAAQGWLAELGHERSARLPLPEEVYAVAARLRRPRPGWVGARLRVQTCAGRWVSLHASWLSVGQGQPDEVAVILQAAAPAEVASVIMAAYGLTEQERVVTGLVCQGLSTRPDRGAAGGVGLHRAGPPEVGVRQDRGAKPPPGAGGGHPAGSQAGPPGRPRRLFA
jgi:hypothetical protein